MKPMFLIAAIGVAIAGMIGYNFIYAPQQQQVQVIRSQIAKTQTHQQTAAEGAGLLHEIERYGQRLPEEPDPSWLVRHVVALAEKTGVQLSTITRDPPLQQDQFTRLAVNLQFNATYHQLGTFLDALERSDEFIRIDRISVIRAADGQPANIQLTVSTLYIPPLVPKTGKGNG